MTYGGDGHAADEALERLLIRVEDEAALLGHSLKEAAAATLRQPTSSVADKEWDVLVSAVEAPLRTARQQEGVSLVDGVALPSSWAEDYLVLQGLEDPPSIVEALIHVDGLGSARPKRRRTWVLLAAAVLAVVLIADALVLLASASRGPETPAAPPGKKPHSPPVPRWRERRARQTLTVLALVLLPLAAACSGGSDDENVEAVTTTEAEATTTTTSRPSTTTSESTTTTTRPPPPVTMPNGEPLFEGYPKLVPIGSVDYRVASWFEGKAPTGELVALAPGVYTPYNPNVPNLNSYLDGPSSGDCAMRNEYFPNTGGACWEGVS